MRIIVFLILSTFLLAASQPVNDSSKTVSEVPSEVKPVVNEIVVNLEESKKISTEIDKEMKRQLELMQEIKNKIAQLKKNSKAVKVVKREVIKLDTTLINGLKPVEPIIEVDGQLVQWETKNRTWVGRILYKNDFIYYPFIVDKNGNKVYLK